MLYIGLDLGQKHDNTAIAIVERTSAADLLVRFLERLPLGTPYPLVVERLARIVSRLRQCCIIVDGTGVGEPVVDMLRRAGLGCEIIAVTITGGQKESRSGSAYSVPKQNLIAGLQLALENGELHVPRKLREALSLVREMLSVRVRSGFSKVRIGADGYGEHDDLVTALSLACWKAQRPRNLLPQGP